jgi:hypothetical protein
LWNDKDEVHEEPYAEAVEARGINPGNEILEILANASKFKILEGRKDGTGQCMRKYGWGTRLGRLKPDDEFFELGQCS